MRSSRDRGVHNLHTEQMDAVWQFWAAGLISERTGGVCRAAVRGREDGI